MVDEARRDGTDLSRVSVENDYELDYWAKRFGVSRDEVLKAVAQVGHRVEDVEHALGRSTR
jgi:hypothetical protein